MEMHTNASLRAVHGFDGSVHARFGLRAWLAGVLKHMRDVRRRRRDYDLLLDKTERELNDIGLTRADVVDAVRHGHGLHRRYPETGPL
ncbi:DUF1127 domain-containing protein [Microbaculum marinum]|uniref:DUF1127 domain-containing protein n=1 Tax=Microbaculum marinum TaxID=1764581 RepID=A0AAW9RU75_9HYPH